MLQTRVSRGAQCNWIRKAMKHNIFFRVNVSAISQTSFLRRKLGGLRKTTCNQPQSVQKQATFLQLSHPRVLLQLLALCLVIKQRASGSASSVTRMTNCKNLGEESARK